MTDERFRREIVRALDDACAGLTPADRQKQRLYEEITGGMKMKRKTRLSLGLVLALALALLAIGAAAAALLSAREVIEQNAVPMAMENDTDARKTEIYSHDQLVALVRAANENGITLDESTGIMRALRQGGGYWEDEAIMEICREAFGGLIDEWTYEEQYWFANLTAEMNGYEKPDMDYPGADDLTAEAARQIADEAVKKAYEGAKDLSDPACYKRQEGFFRIREDGESGSVWSFTYKPLDMIHARYFASVNEKGEITDMGEAPQDWSSYTVGQLENGISENYRSRSHTKSTWSQTAWHVYREMLPGAQRDGGWHAEHDAYLACGYPLPDGRDMTEKETLTLALRDAGITEKKLENYDRVLLSDETGRHLWKITLYSTENARRTAGASWEIDAKTGVIVSRASWAAGDRNWRGYVLETAYQKATEGLLTGEEAMRLAADALRKELGEDGIPYTDPRMFTSSVNFNEWTQKWQVSFRTKTLSYATGAASVTEPDHRVTITNSSPSQVDGDSLWGRYQQIYGASRWTQDIWVRFGKDMAGYQPAGWIGRLLKNTEYLEESAVGMTREQAVDIAFANNDLREEEELDATLIGALPHPVWKVALAGQECIWLYEIDTETGEVLDREKYAPDNYDFDPPVKRYTLHRDFAPAYAAEFGAERLAVIEISKAFGDMTYDDPVATVLGEDMDSESLGGEIVKYSAQVEDRAVTVRPNQPGAPAYRVTFSEAWMTERVEKLPAE